MSVDAGTGGMKKVAGMKKDKKNSLLKQQEQPIKTKTMADKNSEQQDGLLPSISSCNNPHAFHVGS